MDDLWLRYPLVLGTVLGYLDNKSLANCRQVNKTWHNCIANDKTLWHRVITQKLIDNTDQNIIVTYESLWPICGDFQFGS